MENLIIKETKDTPDILFDAGLHRLHIKGKSYPENTSEFFAPVFSWLKEYFDIGEDHPLVVDIDLYYFNSSSSKILLDFFDMLEESAEKGKAVTVNWIYEEDDEDTMEFGESLRDDYEALELKLVSRRV